MSRANMWRDHGLDPVSRSTKPFPAYSAIGYITPQEAEEAFYGNMDILDKVARVLNKTLFGKPGAVQNKMSHISQVVQLGTNLSTFAAIQRWKPHCNQDNRLKKIVPQYAVIPCLSQESIPLAWQFQFEFFDITDSEVWISVTSTEMIVLRQPNLLQAIAVTLQQTTWANHLKSVCYRQF